MSMSISDRIRQIMGSMSQDEFGKSVGVTAQAVNQWLVGKTMPTPQRMKLICDKYGHDLNWLMTGQAWNNEANTENKNSAVVLGPKDLPVYAAVEGGQGEIVVSTDPIEYVQRPWYLGEVRDGYAVIVTGESMVPVYDPGDMVIVNPRLPHMRGKDHIFIDGTQDGSFRASVKRLIRATTDEWIVEQFNPPSELTLPRSTWTEAKRIVGKYVG